MVIDWNAWRRMYDTMSWADQVAFYKRVAARHPDQRFFTADEVRRTLTDIGHPIRVLEIGGWKGELASEVYFDGILEWLNIEVLVDAASYGPGGGWYRATVPSDYIWNTGVPRGYDVLVMSHTIEHMRAAQLDKVINQFDGEWAYFEAPLGPDWHDYAGSHILELDWDGVDQLMHKHGFIKVREAAAAADDARAVTYRRQA